MSGANRTLQFGPATYEVNVAVTGGQLVMPDSTTGKVKPTTAGALTVLGVAMADANPSGTNPTSPLNTAWPQSLVAVGYGPGEFVLTYTGAAAFGVLLKAAAAGAVAPWVDGTDTDPATIVGRCTEPGGLSAAGTGRARLYV